MAQQTAALAEIHNKLDAANKQSEARENKLEKQLAATMRAASDAAACTQQLRLEFQNALPPPPTVEAVRVPVSALRCSYRSPEFVLHLPPAPALFSSREVTVVLKGSDTKTMKRRIGNLMVDDLTKLRPADPLRLLSHTFNHALAESKVDAAELQALAPNGYTGLKQLIRRSLMTEHSELSRLQKALQGMRTVTVKSVNERGRRLFWNALYSELEDPDDPTSVNERHDELFTADRVMVDVGNGKEVPMSFPSAFFGYDDETGEYDFPSEMLEQVTEAVANEFELGEGAGSSMRLMAWVMRGLKRCKFTDERRVQTKGEKLQQPVLMHMDDWSDWVPLMLETLNDMASPDLYPTEDAGLLAYQRNTTYNPPAADAEETPPPKKSKTHGSGGPTSIADMLAL